MFRQARIKLTAWYLAIIMLISISFSLVIYRGLTFELSRIERVQRFRRPIPAPFVIDPEIVKETQQRITLALVSINLFIWGTSAAAGYFLAGRTLQPIKQMVDEQNRFITDASHELRTPLTSLKSEIEVNLRDKKLSIEEARKLFKSNLEEVNNLQALSDGLIKLTQYQKGENGLSFGKMSLAQIISEAVKKVSGLAKNKNITVINKVENYDIDGEKSTLIELFTIFLDNAIKYSSQKTKINLSSKKTDGYVLTRIADQGTGINKKDIPHLFDRFYRTDESRTKSKIKGYGLGLAIAKQIVEKHHGSIKVESKPNKGTAFTVSLPVKQHYKTV